ncbi:oxidoreductase [Streptomyces sp. NPDC096040]|uniref:oxidoreductase n=1 Tax=Streptomyces sp. NPDC096040 TaxID=3155541 RepID=UPI00332497C5
MNPNLTGKTVIVTGANSGIGLVTAKALAGYGAHIVLAVRDTAKGGRAAEAVPGDTEVRQLDLADLASIRRFAADWQGPIHLLINNAGVSAPELERTTDGFELLFGTNHLGPFALTNLLLPHITGRVVSLASQAERMGQINFDDLHWEHTPYKQSRAYATSKLANVLFSSELQRRLTAVGSSVLAVAAHPGLVATNIYDRPTGLVTRLMVRLFAQEPEQGALPVLYAATGDVPGDSFTGPEHWMHMRDGAELIGRSRTAQDTRLARQLWDASEKLTGVSFGL